MDLTRRRLLGSAGAGAAALGLFAAGFSNGTAWASPRFPGDPFRLGVASGDPTPDGIVLWTRLAPDPLALDGRGGMPERRVAVQWQIASDERFSRVARQGTTHAVPELGHSVHVEADGLEPGRDYFYRFRAGGDLSPVGRARTAPDARTRRGDVSFAFASCQCWYEGFYTAYRHMAAEDLDFVVHLGDYLYEYGVGATAGVRGMELDASFQRETLTLADYRNRHALTRLDADLQAAHQAFPWILTWDDHEVENNWAGDIAQLDNDGLPDDTVDGFRARKAAAFQAYYEHLPLRLPQRPNGADVRMYRRLPFGGLLDLHVLDTRSYRDDQVCGDGTKPGCDTERRDPARTMLGAEQERWLLDGTARSGARWNVLANQTLIAQVDQNPDPAVLSSGLDMWDGYTAARDRLLTGLHESGAGNPVVLTGDIHRSVVADLKLDFDDESSPVVATEFAGTSISSGKDGAAMDQVGRNWLTTGVNPHLRWHNSQRGYTVLRLTDRDLRADYRVVPYVTTPGAPVETAGSFVVEAGRPGALPA
ncbi:alkaline phosphatase D family protein [Streptomyces litchfieldiae]|uniref:Alkaline phosphatase D family protein n=1 Tax=Streptomyces litchfieldiae TaxID=3075543 RepID=A0ABU2ML57_9ACTN|nr:alkaline phosphatase D family protein [Streptomyces sp. DSM 44938]MDT0342336.1 alkaline phosphatase D family protein [Streptomyces sp. DSM 44938]